MKPFNLEHALNGEPICASEQKCYVVREVTEFLDDKSIRRFVVIFANSFTDAEIWDEHDLISGDIEMWEEPKISIEDLPKPFKPNNGESYYYICGRTIGYISKYAEISPFDNLSAKNGQCFSTKEDAQKWLDFMKSMME